MPYTNSANIKAVQREVAALKAENLRLENLIEKLIGDTNYKFYYIDSNLINNLNAVIDMEQRNSENIVVKMSSELQKIKSAVEMVVGSRLSVCGYKFLWRGSGRVTYEHLLPHSPPRVLGEELQGTDIFDPDCGVFTAPAPGTYLVSATAVFDTEETNQPRNAKLMFVIGNKDRRRVREFLVESTLYAAPGAHNFTSHNMVQASRSLSIVLKSRDTVHLEQLEDSGSRALSPAANVFTTTFCVSLLNLDMPADLFPDKFLPMPRYIKPSLQAYEDPLSERLTSRRQQHNQDHVQSRIDNQL